MKKTIFIALLLLPFLLIETTEASRLTQFPRKPTLHPASRPPKTVKPEKIKKVPTRDFGHQPKIIGGTNATPTNHPWIAALVFSHESNLYDGQYGGAVLIHPYWVATAGHCVVGMKPHEIDVVLGAYDLKVSSGNEQRIAAAELILHPAYNNTTLDSDIALIRLSEPADARFTPLPIIDAATLANPGTLAQVAGWGMNNNNTIGSPISILQEVNLPIVSLETANASLYYNGGLTTNMLPAGLEEGGKDSAPGDSGGPLTVLGADGVHAVLAGLVSFGPTAGSALPNGYGIYTRVDSFRAFIFSHIMPPYYQWEEHYGVKGRYHDSDGDGRTNLEEFAFGSSPINIDALPITITLSNNYPQLHLITPAGGASIEYTVLQSDSLYQTFSIVGSNNLRTASTPLNERITAITLSDPNPSSSQGFYKLRADMGPYVVAAPRSLPLNSYAAHTITELDPPVAGTDPAHYIKRYTLENLVPGSETTLILRSSDFDAHLALHHASTGTLLQESDSDNAGDTDEQIVFIPQTNATYEARVANVPGNFMLALRDFSNDLNLVLRTAQSALLSTTDPIDPNWLPEVYYFDEYHFISRSNADIQITMTSSKFNPSVSILNGETTSPITRQYSENNTATIQFFAHAGLHYRVQASSTEELQTGSYQLLATTYSFPAIRPDQTISGSLETTDPIDPNYSDDYYIDDYLLTDITPGQYVTITLTSNAFDAFLTIIDRLSGDVLEEIDSTGLAESETTTISVAADKEYIIRVSSFEESATGPYTLQVN